jgi:hypothetical protein
MNPEFFLDAINEKEIIEGLKEFYNNILRIE